MNEYRRLSYLEALGVSSYQPRRILPHAPEPFLCDLPEWVGQEAANAADIAENVAAGAGTHTTAKSEVKTTRTAPQAIGQLLDQVGARAPRSNRPASPQTPAETPAATQPGIDPFSLGVWRSAGLLVVDSRQAMPLPTERLLHNILLSLGGDWASARSAEEILSWPLVDSDREFCTEEHTRGQIEAWLDAELARAPVTRLWVMGETAARYLLPESLSFTDALWQWQALPTMGVQVLVAPSLSELLRQPALKPRLWAALQSLRD